MDAAPTDKQTKTANHQMLLWWNCVLQLRWRGRGQRISPVGGLSVCQWVVCQTLVRACGMVHPINSFNVQEKNVKEVGASTAAATKHYEVVQRVHFQLLPRIIMKHGKTCHFIWMATGEHGFALNAGELWIVLVPKNVHQLWVHRLLEPFSL